MSIATVILPAHREGHLLEASVASVIGQSWKNWVMRLILDRPSPDTRAIARRLSKLDERIELVEVKYGNLGKVLFKEIALVQSEFVIRLDADDVAYGNRFDTQISFMRNNPNIVVSGSNARLIDAENRPFGYTLVPTEHKDILHRLLTGQGSAILHPSSIFRTEALLSCGGYDPKLIRGQDLDLYLKLSTVGILANIPDVLLDFRKHPLSSTSSENPKEAMERRAATIQKFVDRTGYRSSVPKLDTSLVSDPRDFTSYVLLKSLRWGFWSTFFFYVRTALKSPLSFSRVPQIIWKKLRSFRLW